MVSFHFRPSVIATEMMLRLSSSSSTMLIKMETSLTRGFNATTRMEYLWTYRKIYFSLRTVPYHEKSVKCSGINRFISLPERRRCNFPWGRWAHCHWHQRPPLRRGQRLGGERTHGPAAHLRGRGCGLSAAQTKTWPSLKLQRL